MQATSNSRTWLERFYQRFSTLARAGGSGVDPASALDSSAVLESSVDCLPPCEFEAADGSIDVVISSEPGAVSVPSVQPPSAQSPRSDLAENGADAGTVEEVLLDERDLIQDLLEQNLRIDGRLAEGGPGVVYMGHDLELQRDVAIKLLCQRSSRDQVRQRQFVLEGKLTGGLQHPGIVPVYSCGTTRDGRAYYTMPLIRGSDFHAVILRYHHTEKAGPEGPLLFRQHLARLVQVCDIVSYAHIRGVLHCDLKPANIRFGKYGEVVVLDWGMAQLFEPVDDQNLDEIPIIHSLDPGDVFCLQTNRHGTPRFTCPEQATCQGNLDARSDVYSLGATLFMLLCGQPPYASVCDDEAMERIVRGEVPSARSVDPSVPPVLDAICRKAMAHGREDRYATVEAFKGDLERWLADEPVKGVAEGASERLRRWERRHRTGIGVAAIGLVVLSSVVGLAAVLIERGRQRAAEGQRSAEAARAQVELEKTRGTALTIKTLIEESLSELNSDHARQGLLDLTRALSMNSPSDAPILDRAIRSNLTAWSESIHTLVSCVPHSGPVRVIAASPHGLTVATTGQDGIIRLWDALSEREIATCSSSSQPVNVLRFSPDGLYLASGSNDGSARLWNAATGEPIGTPLLHAGPVIDLLFTSDSSQLATASSDGTAQFWFVPSGDRSGQPLLHGGEPLVRLALSPDGQELACQTTRGRLCLWDRARGSARWLDLPDRSPPSPFAFTPDGRGIVIASNRSVARVDLETSPGQIQTSGERFHTGIVTALTFSPDGRDLLTCSYDTACMIWTLPGREAAGALIKPRLGVRQNGYLWDVAVSPDGRYFATATDATSVQIWDRQTGRPVGERLPHGAAVRRVVFLPDGESLLTGCDDGHARVWRLGSSSQVGPGMIHGDKVDALALHPDGKLFASSSEDGRISLWNVNDARLSARAQGHDPDHRVRELSFTNSEGPRPLLISAGDDGRVRFWDPDTLEPDAFEIRVQYPPIRKIAIDPSGRKLAVADNVGRLGIWDLKTLQPLVDISTQPVPEPEPNEDQPVLSPSAIVSMVFHPSGTLLAVGNDRGLIRLWNTGDDPGPLAVTARHANAVRGLEFSSDGQFLASASRDRTARIWEARTLKPVTAPLEHQAWVWSVRFSPDSLTLASTSFDGTVRLWETRSGAPRGRPLLHGDLVYGAIFTSNGARIVTYGRSPTVQVWDTATLLPIGPPMATGGEVVKVLLLPDEERFVTAGHDSTARIWRIPPMMSGDVDSVIDRIRLITGYASSTSGLAVPLTAQAWLDLRSSLGRPARP